MGGVELRPPDALRCDDQGRVQHDLVGGVAGSNHSRLFQLSQSVLEELWLLVDLELWMVGGQVSHELLKKSQKRIIR